MTIGHHLVFGRRYIPYFPTEPEYQAVLDRATALGFTLPSSTQQNLDNNIVHYLKAEGMWNELDLLYIFQRASSESNFARINWKNPSSYLLTSPTPPTFENNLGFKGDGSKYWDTGYIPNTHKIKALLSDTSVFHGVYQTGTGTSWGTRNASGNNFMSNSSTNLGGTTAVVGATGGPIGDYLAVKNGTTHNRYLSGVFNNTWTYTSNSLSTYSLTLFAWNLAGVPSQQFTGGLKYFGLGSKQIEAKALRLYQILNHIY